MGQLTIVTSESGATTYTYRMEGRERRSGLMPVLVLSLILVVLAAGAWLGQPRTAWGALLIVVLLFVPSVLVIATPVALLARRSAIWTIDGREATERAPLQRMRWIEFDQLRRVRVSGVFLLLKGRRGWTIRLPLGALLHPEVVGMLARAITASRESGGVRLDVASSVIMANTMADLRSDNPPAPVPPRD